MSSRSYDVATGILNSVLDSALEVAESFRNVVMVYQKTGSVHPIGFIGLGGQARELKEYCGRPISFHAVDEEYFERDKVCVDLSSPDADALSTEVLLAIGAPGAKRSLISRWPGRRYATVVAESAFVSESAKIGLGSVIAPNAALMAGVSIGEHVLINTGAVVSHDVTIADYATISPGVAIGGHVSVECGVFVGIGATLRDRITIGSGAVIGAGSVVLGSVEPYTVVVGVPARTIGTVDDWLMQI